jgi:hypothetical protein
MQHFLDTVCVVEIIASSWPDGMLKSCLPGCQGGASEASHEEWGERT